MSEPVSDEFLTFAPVTALLLSWLVPTLFFGSVVAAQLTPPSAMNSASELATLAYVIRGLRIL